MNLLLDTCSLLWLVDDPAALPAKVRTRLNHAASVVHVSALSCWELGLKVGKGKLVLPDAVGRWFSAVLAHYDLREVGISAQLAAASTELPRLHADPFDRLLIATAQAHQCTLVTSDQNIRKYPNLKVLW